MLIFSFQAKAVLTIDITQGVKDAIPIAVVPFHVSPKQRLPESIWDVVSADLERSGRFRPLPEKDFLSKPRQVSEVQFKDWRLLKVNAIIIGQVLQLSDNRFEVNFKLMDVFNERQLLSNKYVVKAKLLRKVAHSISDLVYQKLTGVPGAFDTKIAYVLQQGKAKARSFSLQVSDADGYRETTIVQSPQPIMSPAWSPQADKLAYVSFEQRRAQIYVQNLRTGQRQLVSDHPRINSAPAWSPDGQSLAMSLSKDGNSEIYIKNIVTGALKRLTHNQAIDTEPQWSADGQQIVFSSGRAGKPQIYVVSANGGKPRRITFQGNYNTDAAFSPDGSKIVLITDAGGGYKVGVYDMARRTVKTLTTTRLDESPSFAPNGEMILYSTIKGGKNVLAMVTSDGSVQRILRVSNGSVKSPAWSPRL